MWIKPEREAEAEAMVSVIREIAREEIAKALREREQQAIEVNADAVANVVIQRLVQAQRRAE